MEVETNHSKRNVVEANYSKNIVFCSKNMEVETNPSKRKVVEDNYSKNIVSCSKNAITGRHYYFYIMSSHHKFYGVLQKF